MTKNFLLTILFFSLTLLAQAQKNYGETVNVFSKAFPYEKIYIHTDKPYYFPSDTIWFKAYVTTSEEDFRQSPTPSVPLYVELIKPSVIPFASRKIIKLKDGKGEGDFVIPRDLKTGIYKLRAYTAYSLNFGDQAFFEKEVFISDIGQLGMLQVNENDYSIFIYPEGGTALAGIKQRFAIQSLDNNGNGIPVNGQILSAMNEKLIDFSTDESGLGIFEFTPLANERYQIQTFNQRGTRKTINLPDFDTSGYALKIDPISDRDQLKIKVTRINLKQEAATNLFIIQNGFVIEEIGMKFRNDEATLELSTQDFSPGLTVFKLVINGDEPIAERLVYLAGEKEVSVEISPSKSSYFPKEKVDLEIKLLDHLGKPIHGEFSISITDAKQVIPTKSPSSIATFSNLISELSGKANAQHFPIPQDPIKLDNFLMTQFWRGFFPELEFLNGNKNPYVFETGLNIAGQVRDDSRDSARDLRLLLIDKDGYPEIHEGHTDEKGNFVFLGMDFTDSVGVYIQSFELKSRRKKDAKEIKSGKIHLHQLEIPPIPQLVKLPEIVWIDLLEKDPYLQEVKNINEILRKSFLMNEFELEEFVVKGRRAYRQDPRTIAYNDDPDIRLRIPEAVYNYYNIIELLQARATRRNVTINPSNNYFIDGNFSSYQMVATLRVSEIEFVDILDGRRPNQMNLNGRLAFNILTKKGNPNFDWSSVEVSGTRGFNIQGYAPTREFYIPPDKQDINSPIALDYRSTIYWNPTISTDDFGRALVSFPLSEGATTVHVDVQGISDSGQAFHGKMEFTVESKL
ncbi:MG2 domain-containing protein [Cecembia rubra]|uniref:Macroglobulin domain-containing protein n=1 Tax=Cecembia rubra TaxID=1485585 RepID=A0A2P8DTC8_9BACT|nr:MG2 domain-containing protein [Cecembia rubra]PSL00473.1 hypothetical protein CLV48_11525 [Cecembia rubra]